MSFKRDGSDSCLLKTLQHRRVAEILGDHIPDDEATLLSNGRLTCTVCSKRPVFDTIQMLSLHRKGKKHLFELSEYLQHKRDLEYKKAKQTQKSFLKTEQITIEHQTSSSVPFAGYSKRKTLSNLFCRKFILDLPEPSDRLKHSLNLPVHITSSANSEVRRYLKSLSRKRPFEKKVNKLKENYGNSEAQSEKKQKTEVKTETKKSDESGGSGRKEVDYHIKLLESGWVQDSNGKWVKDPNVEFDSDEDQPPTFS